MEYIVGKLDFTVHIKSCPFKNKSENISLGKCTSTAAALSAAKKKRPNAVLCDRCTK